MAGPNWKNQTIWTADDLDVLRGMNSESVGLICLDPAFNANCDYAAPIGSKAAGATFNDTWTLSDVDLAWIGIIAEKEPDLSAVNDAAGLAHGKGMKPYKTHKHTLYVQQEGQCAGCQHHFPLRNLTVDPVVARSKGGTDHPDNLQLRCGACNSMKGTMDQATFAALLERGDRALMANSDKPGRTVQERCDRRSIPNAI